MPRRSSLNAKTGPEVTSTSTAASTLVVDQGVCVWEEEKGRGGLSTKSWVSQKTTTPKK